MQTNVGTTDRIIRAIAAIAALIGALALGIGTVGGILLLVGTGVAGWAVSTLRPANFGVTRMTGAPYILAKHRGGARIGHDTISDSMYLDGLEDAYTPGKLMTQVRSIVGLRLSSRQTFGACQGMVVLLQFMQGAFIHLYFVTMGAQIGDSLAGAGQR